MNNVGLKEIGLSGNAKLVENEIEKLKSYDLMEDVVDTLQLFVSVKKIGRIRDFDIFGDEIPFTVEIINPEAIKQSRHWKITYEQNNLLFQSENDRQPFLIQYGQTYKSGNISFRCLLNGPIPDTSLRTADSSAQTTKLRLTHRMKQRLRLAIDYQLRQPVKYLLLLNWN